MNNQVDLTLRTQRNTLPNWQLLKLILSSLIVLSFYLSFNPQNKETFSLLINVFNLTLIPMFVFISGYTTKEISWHDWPSHILPALIIYVTFQSIDMIPLYFNGTLELRSYLLLPQHGVWFFLAVPIWQLAFLSMPAFIKNNKLTLLILLFISLIISYLSHKYIAEISALFSIIYYFPFFIMAYFCNDNILLWIRKKSILIMLCSVIVAVTSLIYQSNIIHFLSKNVGALEVSDLLLSDLLSFVASLLLGYGIVYLALSTDKFQKVAKNALGIYLIHPLICFLILTGLASLQIELGVVLPFVLALCTITICLLLATNPVINWFLNPVLKTKITK